MELLIVLWLGCAVICAAVASGKGYGGCLWGFLGLCFGIFALLIVALLPPVRRDPVHVTVQAPEPRREPPASASKAPASKICPECAETILKEAKLCRFCGYRFDGTGQVKAIAAPEPAPVDYARYTAPVTALKALAEAAGYITQEQQDEISRYLWEQVGRTGDPRRDFQTGRWLTRVVTDEASLREALNVVARLPKGMAADFVRAVDGVLRESRAGDLARQHRFAEQLRKLAGNIQS